ncbi:MAG: BREX system P-loop protein BrxC, partial [Bradymonadaceae bacterium]
YHRSLIQACLAGLLRAGKIEIQPQGGKKITSYRDPGSQDLFGRVRELRSASFMPAGTGPVSPRDRVKICKFFDQRLDQNVEREDEAIADAVFERFPKLLDRHDELTSTFEKLPDPVTLPQELVELGEALRACVSSRQIEETVEGVKRQLDTLRDGLQLLSTVDGEVQETQREVLRDAHRARENHHDQLDDVDQTNDRTRQAAEEIEDVLATEFPWRNLQALSEATEVLEERYRDVRASLLERQGEVAENARNEIKQRDGYRTLSDDESHKVLRPVAKATVDTNAESLYPTLAKIKSAIEVRIPEALAGAHDRLDEIIEDDKPVRKLSTRLRNRTIEDEQELEAVLEELEERAKEHLEKGDKVRFV